MNKHLQSNAKLFAVYIAALSSIIIGPDPRAKSWLTYLNEILAKIKKEELQTPVKREQKLKCISPRASVNEVIT